MSSFLTRVLPDKGQYIIAVLNKYIKHYSFDSREAAEEFALSKAGSADVYFACSSYNLHRNERGQLERKADYALRQKAIWLDLDCDSEKALGGSAYATQHDALLALQRFLKVTNLPMPLLVNSGYGFHAYWTFTQSIPTAVWKKVAGLFRTICTQQGLLVDHHRTCDAASILRVPGTINHKRGGMVPVAVALDTGTDIDPAVFIKRVLALAGACGVATQAPVNPSVNVPPEIAANFGQTYEFKPEDSIPRDCSQMIVKCRQLREMGSSSYPNWMLGIRTILTTSGMGKISPEATVHALSRVDKEKYNPEYTDRTIENLKKSKYGAGLCETFCANDPQKCKDCPYWGKIKSPYSLGSLPEKKQVTLNTVSADKIDTRASEIALGDANSSVTLDAYSDENFQVCEGRGVIKKSVDDDGVAHFTVISPLEIYIHTLCIDTTGGGIPRRTYIMRKRAPGCAEVDIPFVIEDALGAQKMEIWLAQCGMMPEPRFKKAFFDFMSTYISAVQNKLPEVYVRNHFGWENWTDKTTGKSYDGFIVGNRMFTAQGTKPVMLDERAERLTGRLDCRGSLDEWKQIPALYSKLDQKFGQLLICTAFGAPLMRYGVGTATNVAYNIWDINGGKGKSSLLKAIASVWGDPNQLLMGRTDTYAARFQQYAVYRNIPILIDEITGIADSEAADMLYNIVNGREKARSTSTGTGLAQSGHWDTITVFTANQSMYETLRSYKQQSAATSMRVIEARCDFADYSNKPEAALINRTMSAMNDNYGLAGPVFIEYLLKHPEVKNQIIVCAEKFSRIYAQKSDERFWLYGMAIPLYAGAVAKKLGLIDYDITALIKYCTNVLLPAMRTAVRIDAPTGDNILMDFLNDNIQDTLIVAASTRNRFEKQKDSDIYDNLRKQNFSNPAYLQDPYIIQMPSRQLHIRRVYDTGITYISSAYLQRWCTDRGISLDSMLSDIAARGLMPKGLNTTTHILGRDVVSYAQKAQRVYRVLIKEQIKNGSNDEE